MIDPKSIYYQLTIPTFVPGSSPCKNCWVTDHYWFLLTLYFIVQRGSPRWKPHGSRKASLLAANDREDKNIAKLEKLLNLRRRKKKKQKRLPASFWKEGLGCIHILVPSWSLCSYFLLCFIVSSCQTMEEYPIHLTFKGRSVWLLFVVWLRCRYHGVFLTRCSQTCWTWLTRTAVSGTSLVMKWKVHRKH